MDFEQMQKEIKALREELNLVKKELEDKTYNQDDFSGAQVFRREVQFLGEVKNAAGTVVIN